MTSNSNCNCIGENITIQCKSCNGGCNNSCNYEITQKRIWKQVRTYSSLFTMTKASANVIPYPNNLPLPQYFYVNWNQSSDRNKPSIQEVIVPTRGNSTRTSITRERPGCCSPGGKGVDIKHNSYDRRLNRLKSNLVRTQCETTQTPLYGNKKQTYGLLSSNCCKC
jgi:hypothetical protein